MARPTSKAKRKYAIGIYLQTVRPWVNVDSKSKRGFVKDFFDLVLDDSVPRGPLSDEELAELSKDAVKGGVFRGINQRDIDKFWRGDRKLPTGLASRFLSGFSSKKLIELVNGEASPEAVYELGVRLIRKGAELKTTKDVGPALAKLLKQILLANSQGCDPTDEEDSSEAGPSFKYLDYFSLSSGRIEGNTLRLEKSSVKISPPPETPPVPDEHELYVAKMLDAYAEHLGQDSLPFERCEELPPLFHRHLVRQRSNYWAAVGRQRNLREIRPSDGDQHFERIKDDLDEGLVNTWMNPGYPDAYHRMLATLEQASGYPLEGSVLTALQGMFAGKEKQGLTHMLVNEDRVQWVIE